MSAAPDPSLESTGLAAVTARGLKWSYASSFINMLLQVGVTAVLARVLTPSEFGVVAMATLFVKFGQYFAQMGVGQAIVQRAEITARDIQTAFTSSAVLGIVFCALFVGLAPLSARLFPDTAGVVDITRAMSVVFIFGGLSATTQGLLRRRFAFRAIAVTDIGTYFLFYATVGLVLALAGLGAWSLVMASLTQGALAALAFALLCRGDLGIALDRGSLLSLYSFGARSSLISFGEFIGSSLDTLWAGRYLGSTALGYYTRATNLAIAPLYYATMSLWRVLLPAFSRIQDQRQRLKSAYLQTITVVAIVVMATSWGASAAAEEIVSTVLGPQWDRAVPVLRVLALAVPFILLTDFAAVVCEATAALNRKIAITVGRIVAIAVLLAVLTPFGIVGVAAAFGLSAFVVHVAYAIATKRRLGISSRELAGAYTLSTPVGVLTGLVVLGLHYGLRSIGCPSPGVLVVQLLAGVLILTLTITRARGGSIWHALRARLGEAGYQTGGGGLIGRLIRVGDAIAP